LSGGRMLSADEDPMDVDGAGAGTGGRRLKGGFTGFLKKR